MLVLLHKKRYSDQRLARLHENVKKYGTVFNTVSPGTELNGVLVRKQAS